MRESLLWRGLLNSCSKSENKTFAKLWWHSKDCSIVSTTTLVIIFWQFTVFQSRFDFLQVKRSLISSIIDFNFELPHKFSKGLKTLWILGQYKISRKSKNRLGIRPYTQPPLQKRIFSDSNKKIRKSRY